MVIVLVKVDRMIWSTEEVDFSGDGSRPASVMTCVIASPNPSDRAGNLQKKKGWSVHMHPGRLLQGYFVPVTFLKDNRVMHLQKRFDKVRDVVGRFGRSRVSGRWSCREPYLGVERLEVVVAQGRRMFHRHTSEKQTSGIKIYPYSPHVLYLPFLPHSIVPNDINDATSGSRDKSKLGVRFAAGSVNVHSLLITSFRDFPSVCRRRRGFCITGGRRGRGECKGSTIPSQITHTYVIRVK